MSDDDDSCTVKYIEIVPRDKFNDCLDATDLKCEPDSVKVSFKRVFQHRHL